MKSPLARKIIVVSALAAAPLCQAQPNVIVDKALAYQQQKQWDRALAVLREGTEACPQQPDADGCRHLLQYSTAYAYEQQAAAEPQSEKELLARAAGIYHGILKQVPAHSPTINNLLLIYQRLGALPRAEALVADAVTADPKNADRYRLMLADIYESAGEPGRARDSLLKALNDSESADIRSRLVALLRNEKEPDLKLVFNLGRRWEQPFPMPARSAFETVMWRGYESAGPLAEQALVRWVSLLGRNNNLSLASLRGLPPKWNAEAVGQLQAFLNNPWTPLAEDNWWRDPRRPERGAALAAAALSLGSQTLASGQAAARVEKCWRIGLDASPPYEYYRVASLPDSEQGVRLDLVTSLISLYDRYPNLETAGSFDQLQCDLFHGKNDAYYLEDLEAIQRHHTILGLLYASKGMWARQQNLNCSSPSMGQFVVEGRFRDAFFQLESAIRIAERRASRPDGVYQPLAQLKQRLAEGAERIGGAGSGQRTRWRIAALEAFLDEDDLEGARRNQAWAREQWRNLSPEERGAVERLSNLLLLRLEAANPDSTLQRALGRGPLPRESLRPLVATPADRFSQGFLERQRFKVLADLSAQAEKLGPASQRGARSAAYEAYRGSLDARLTLIGAADVQRIQHVTNTLAATLGIAGAQASSSQYVSWSARKTVQPPLPPAGPRPAPEPGGPREAPSGLRVSLDSRSALVARLDPRIVLGGEIVKAVGIEQWISSDAELAVTAGQVRVKGVERSTVDLEPVLKAQPNYRSAKVEYGKKAAPQTRPPGTAAPGTELRNVPRKTAPR
jgi:hypothetical protein